MYCFDQFGGEDVLRYYFFLQWLWYGDSNETKNSFILAKVATKYKEKCNLLMPKGVQAGLRAPQLIYRGLINHIVH